MPILAPTPERARTRRGSPGVASRRKKVAIGLLGAVVAIPAAAYLYLAWVVADAPPPARLEPAGSTTGGPEQVDGDWVIDESTTDFAGYRIREQIGPIEAPGDAVGRTSDVSGWLRLEGETLTALSVNVTMTTLRSDASRRDERLRTMALETDRFPRASFDLADPVALGPIERGRVLAARVMGTLELHGVTRPAAFDVQARWDGPAIHVAGSGEVVLDDFDIEVSAFAAFGLSSSGTVEFEVEFVPLG